MASQSETAADTNGVDPLFSIGQVMQLVPLSASHIYRLIRSGHFPAQVKLGPSRSAWRKSEIIAYIADPTGWASNGC